MENQPHHPTLLLMFFYRLLKFETLDSYFSVAKIAIPSNISWDVSGLCEITGIFTNKNIHISLCPSPCMSWRTMMAMGRA
jgi:hypothetical protein